MIKPIEMYTVICDRCGKDVCDTPDCDYSCFSTPEWVREVASNDDWQVINDKDYCPACYELDEETDEYVVKATEETI